ncbi:Utp14 protein-domain-containing protein [Obelidium mucronatum]|nr:Utp14 protein-domain-containing protein [Obelidium mucronatum]
MIAKRQELVKLRSKTYRKIHKKDALRKAAKDRSDLTLEELKDLDPDAAREKAEKTACRSNQGLRERMTLKHKSTGKWARKMLARGDRGDEESRQALMDQLSQNQNLTRKIAGLESDEDSDALNSDSDDDLEGLDSGARAKKRGAAALADLEDQIARDHSEMESEAPKKGIFAMKFMQRGLERQMNESKQLLAEARQALEDEANEEDLDSDEDVQTKKVTTKSKPKAVGVGRMVFGMQEEDDDDDEEDEEDENVKSNDARVSSSQFDMKMSKPVSISLDGTKNGFTVSKGTDVFSAKISNVQFGDEQPVPTKQSKKSKSTIAQAPIIAPTHPSATSKSQKSESSAAEDASNPWLATDTAFTKKSTKLNVTHADKAMERMNKLKSLQKASETADDMDFTLNLDGVRKLEVVKPQKQQPGKPSQVPSKAVPSAGKQETAIATTHSDSPTVYGPIKPTTATKPKPQKVISYDSEEDSDEEAVFNKISSNFIHSSDIKTLTQRELMQIAFANDNVATAEFEQEKTRTVEADAPEVVDNTLPGWGSWAGNGVEPKANLFTTVKTKVDSVVATKRKDAKLNHVIINEKKIRKAGKYLAKDLPFGYESREQYEQAIRMPLGVEWNTTASHARLTAPKVVTKMGTIIHPIKLAGNGASKEGEKKKTPGNKKDLYNSEPITQTIFNMQQVQNLDQTTATVYSPEFNMSYIENDIQDVLLLAFLTNIKEYSSKCSNPSSDHRDQIYIAVLALLPVGSMSASYLPKPVQIPTTDYSMQAIEAALVLTPAYSPPPPTVYSSFPNVSDYLSLTDSPDSPISVPALVVLETFPISTQNLATDNESINFDNLFWDTDSDQTSIPTETITRPSSPAPVPITFEAEPSCNRSFAVMPQSTTPAAPQLDEKPTRLMNRVKELVSARAIRRTAAQKSRAVPFYRKPIQMEISSLCDSETDGQLYTKKSERLQQQHQQQQQERSATSNELVPVVELPAASEVPVLAEVTTIAPTVPVLPLELGIISATCPKPPVPQCLADWGMPRQLSYSWTEHRSETCMDVDDDFF